MSELITAARPYAKALYEVAAQKDIESWKPLMRICQVLGEDYESKSFLNNHDLTKSKFYSFIQNVFSKNNIDNIPEKFNSFIDLLIKNNRLALLPEIARIFISELNKSNDTIVAEIITAKTLTKDSYNKLIKGLERKYSKTIDASIVIDETLIGGALIRVGDSVIDGSIKGRLEQLIKALN